MSLLRLSIPKRRNLDLDLVKLLVRPVFSAQSPPPNILFKVAPKVLHEYMKLARLDSPTGTWLVYLPSTWSIALAAPHGCLPDPYILTLFGVGAFLMRGAGCTVNDMLDRDVDRGVFRTKDRPLAVGSLPMSRAVMFLALELSLALAILLQLNMESVFIGSSCVGLVLAYPLFKRFTHWPQLMLGLTLNWGVLMGYTAVNGFSWSICLPLYLCGVCQTIMYDSVYSHQDVKDDLRLGLKSTAILFGDDTKKWLSVFFLGMAACLATVGVTSHSGCLYFAGAGLSLTQLGLTLYNTDLRNPASCFKYFRSNRHFGLLLFGSIVFDKYFPLPFF